ncbi:ubx domain-containing protein [Stemphylium lycopersici]|nr:ubx domain-containing protein [Stemphylium lycopersici]
MTDINPLDVLAIKNVVSRYCQALDLKDFDMLGQVFDTDVDANYPFNPNLKSLNEVKDAIKNRLGPIRTHHNLTTQTITFRSDAQTARVVTHFQGVHFGQGPHEGKLLCAYGKYVDDMALVEGNGGDYDEHVKVSWQDPQRVQFFATPIILLGAEMNKDDAATLSPIDWRHFEKVPKRRSRFAEAKWRYMFETARRAWGKMVFDPVALQALEKMLTNITAYEWSSEKEELPEAISAGHQTPEGQNIAIEQTLALLMKRNDHYDKVYEFLEAELNGRRRRQKKSDLTVKQQHLIARLRDNADDLKMLHEGEEEDGSFDLDHDNQLIADRGKLIQQILKELAQPVGVRDGVKPNYTSSSEHEDNATNFTWHSKEVLNKVEQFKELTGIDFDDAEAFLLSAEWDLEAALEHYYDEEQEANDPASADTSPKIEAQNEAVKRFVDVTHTQFPIAKSYLVEARWDESLATAKFFNDKDVIFTASKLIYPAPSAIPPPTGSVSDKPTTHIPACTDSPEKNSGMEDSSETIAACLKMIEKLKAATYAQEPLSLTTGNPEKDRNTVSELMQLSGVSPEIAKYYLMHNEWNMLQAVSKFLEQSPAAENAESEENETRLDKPPKTPTKETRLSSAPGSPKNTGALCKPVATNGTNLEAQQAKVQRGLSHTGLPIIVDAVGNFVAHRGCISGTSYQQYRAMRRRLRVNLTDDQKAAVRAERAKVQAITDDAAAKEAAEIAQVLAVAEEAERMYAEEIADVADKQAKARDSSSCGMASLSPPSDPLTPDLTSNHSSVKKGKASYADPYGLTGLPPTLAMPPSHPIRSGSSGNMKKLTLKLRMNLGDPNNESSNTAKDGQVLSPAHSPTPEEAKVSEEGQALKEDEQKKKDEQFAADYERNLLQAEMHEEEEKEKERKRKRALFVSEQDDAWDGFDNDEVDADLDSDGDEDWDGDSEDEPMVSNVDEESEGEEDEQGKRRSLLIEETSLKPSGSM